MAAIVFSALGRGGEMRNAEDDFQAGLTSTTAPTAAMPPAVHAKIKTAPAARQQDLSAWYAESAIGSVDPAPKDPTPPAPQGATTAPVDDSHLINDTAPLVDTAPLGQEP
ncbi:hypothetical protein FEV51_06935 [Qipengyuania marisflavi]|uniref:Uncharacterized protein n=1 Tax=Qipengyuania marisflavi TaxID=2486356 RepID=A0A5S3P545_9SPHN|nr:hypothetical protein FEV51_06935 [Qipengyuania marisflavi]